MIFTCTSHLKEGITPQRGTYFFFFKMSVVMGAEYNKQFFVPVLLVYYLLTGLFFE